MNPRPWSLLFLGLVLAGCFHGGEPPPPTTTWTPLDGITFGCINGNCLANSSSKDYQRVLQRYNLTQITQGDGAFALKVDSGLLLWQDSETREGEDVHPGDEGRDEIWLYEFDRERLVPLDVDPCYHRVNPELAGGRATFVSVRYDCAPEYGTGGVLIWWDLASRLRHVQPTGLSSGVVLGFDGEWALIRHTGAQNESMKGLWVRNVEDGRQYQLYTFPPWYYQPKLDNKTEVLTGTEVVAGRAYAAFYRQNFTRDPGHGIFTESTIMEWDLENGTSRVFGSYRGGVGGGQLTKLDVSQNYVVWASVMSEDAAYVNYANRTGDGTAIRVSLDEDGYAFWPKAQGPWIVYHSSRHYERPWQNFILGYHVPSGSRHVLLTMDEYFASNTFDTDGERLVLEGNRLDSRFFESIGSDLYWRLLPDV